MSIITVKGFITVLDEDSAAVLKELPNHIELTRKETGCLTFEVIQDQSNKCRFNVYEEFSDKESFVQHQNRVQTSLWGEITKNVERSYTVEGL